MSFTFKMPFTRVWKQEGELWFEGVASSTALDEQRERMSKSALESMCAFRGIDLLPSHDARPLDELGTVEQGRVEGEQFLVMGKLDPTNPDAVRLFERLNAGKRYGLSVGGNVTSAHYELEANGRRVRVIDGVVLDHIAVTRPGQAANPDTWLQAIAKSAAAGDWPERPERVERAASRLLPLADEDTPWDAAAAQKRVARWASSDNSGDRDTIDWDRFGRAFMWHDPQRADQFGGYKLPFADVIDGQLRAVWRACAAIAARLDQTDIPEADRDAVRNKLRRYYAAFEKPFPGDEGENATTKGDEQTMDEENVQKRDASADVQKGASVSFMENLAEEESERDVWDVMDGLWATLTTTLRAILAGDGDKRALSAQAVADFGNVVVERVAGAPAEGDRAVTLSASADESAEGDAATSVEGDADAGDAGPDEMVKAVSGRLDRLEKALEERDRELAERDRQLEDLQKSLDASREELEKAQERIKELEAQPAAGGPVSTAARDDEDRAGGDSARREDPFAKTVEEARRRLGTADASAAQRRASEFVAAAVSDMLFGARTEE